MGDNPPEERRLILIGKTGSGKSASGNTILGLPGHFLSKCSTRSVTQVCQLGTSEYHVEEEVVVVDLPGFGGTNLSQEQITTEVRRCVMMTVPGPHAFLLVVPLGRYTEEDNMAVTVMAAVFGEAALRNHTVVLFTHGDELEEPMEEYLASAPAHLKTLIDRCGGRYHVLNNRAPSDVKQVHKLLRKVEQVVDDNGGGCYTNAMYLEAEAASREEEDRLRMEEQEDRLRMEEQEDRLRMEEQEVPCFSRVLQRVKMVVAAALTGLVVGAVCGATVDWAAAHLGAAIGGFIGAARGVLIGLKANSPWEGARKALSQVGTMGVFAVGTAGLSAISVQSGAAATVLRSRRQSLKRDFYF